MTAAGGTPEKTLFLGLVSDTHGALAPGVLPLFRGADAILHAGDVGDTAILAALRSVASVTAVRGNVDFQGSGLAARACLTWSGLRIGVLHDAGADGAHAWAFAAAQRLDIVVCGHSHRHGLRLRGAVRLLNPGAAGPSRFGLRQTAARLIAADGRCSAEWYDVSARPILIDAEEWALEAGG